MEIKNEIKETIKANKEVIIDLYRDTIITYIKLMLIFPKQSNERNLFIKQLFKFKDILIEEIKFFEYLIKISKLDNEEKIYEILNDLDITFEQEYLYYDDIVSYMEKSIRNKQLNFSNVPSKESIILTKIKLYKSELLGGFMENNYNISKIYTVEYLLNKLQNLNYFGRKIYVYEHYKEFLKNPSVSSIEMIDNHALEYYKQVDVDFNIGRRIYTKFKFYKECLKYVFFLLDEQEREELFNSLSIENKEYLDYVLYHKFPINIKCSTKLLIKR